MTRLIALFLAEFLFAAPSHAEPHADPRPAPQTAAGRQTPDDCRTAVESLHAVCSGKDRTYDEQMLAWAPRRFAGCEGVDDKRIAAIAEAAAWPKASPEAVENNERFHRLISDARAALLVSGLSQPNTALAASVKESARNLKDPRLKLVADAVAKGLLKEGVAWSRQLDEALAFLPVYEVKPTFPLQNLCANFPDRHSAYASDARFPAWETLIALSLHGTDPTGTEVPETAHRIADLLAERDKSRLRAFPLKNLLLPLVTRALSGVTLAPAPDDGNYHEAIGRHAEALVSHLSPALGSVFAPPGYSEEALHTPRLGPDKKFEVVLPGHCEQPIQPPGVLKRTLFGAASRFLITVPPRRDIDKPSPVAQFVVEMTCGTQRRRYNVPVCLEPAKLAALQGKLRVSKSPPYTAFDEDGVRRGLILLPVTGGEAFAKKIEKEGLVCRKEAVADFPEALLGDMAKGAEGKVDYFLNADNRGRGTLDISLKGNRFLCVKEAAAGRPRTEVILYCPEEKDRQELSVTKLARAVLDSGRTTPLLYLDLSEAAVELAAQMFSEAPDLVLPVPSHHGHYGLPMSNAVLAWIAAVSKDESYETMRSTRPELAPYFQGHFPDQPWYPNYTNNAVEELFNQGLIHARLALAEDSPPPKEELERTGKLPPGTLKFPHVIDIPANATGETHRNLDDLRDAGRLLHSELSLDSVGPERRMALWNVAFQIPLQDLPTWGHYDWIGTAYQKDRLTALDPTALLLTARNEPLVRSALRDQGTLAEPALLAALHSGNSSLQILAAKTLGKLGPDLRGDNHQRAIVEGVLMSQGTDVISKLAPALSSASRREIETLWLDRFLSGPESEKPSLLRKLLALKDLDEATRRQIGKHAAELTPVTQLALLQATKNSDGPALTALAPVVEELLKNPSTTVKAASHAAKTGARAEIAVPRLVAALDRADAKSRETPVGDELYFLTKALAAYAAAGNTEALEILDRYARGTPVSPDRPAPSEITRFRAQNELIASLEGMTGPSAERVRQAVDDYRFTTTHWHTNLSQVRTAPEITRLATILATPDPKLPDYERNVGFTRLAELGPQAKPALEKLIQIYQTHSETHTRRQALRVIASMGPGVAGVGDFLERASVDDKTGIAAVGMIAQGGAARTKGLAAFRKCLSSVPEQDLLVQTLSSVQGSLDDSTRRRMLDAIFSSKGGYTDPAVLVGAFGDAALPAMRTVLDRGDRNMKYIVWRALERNPAMVTKIKEPLLKSIGPDERTRVMQILASTEK